MSQGFTGRHGTENSGSIDRWGEEIDNEPLQVRGSFRCRCQHEYQLSRGIYVATQDLATRLYNVFTFLTVPFDTELSVL